MSIKTFFKTLHTELVRWRLPHVSILLLFVLLEIDAWEFYKENHNSLEQSKAIGFLGFNAAVVGIITVCLKFMGSKYEKDSHDE